MDFIVQVAGIHDREEAQEIVNAGANWLGIPLRLPSGNDDISEQDAKELISNLDHHVHAVLITYSTDADEIQALTKNLGFSAVQLHGDIDPNEIGRLREQNSDLIILKSLVVDSKNAQDLLATIDEVEDIVDMFLTDTYNPTTGAMGATGLRHDWNVSKLIVEHASKPVIIAGGLNPSNVYEAVRFIKPAGVDAHTGLENSHGRKDFALVKEFTQAALRGFAGNEHGNETKATDLER